LKSETIDNLTILLAAISETVASNKGPWMQFSSLSINSSLQNNPRYSEELVGNDEICIQGHFYEAIIFKMAANKIVKLSMVSDFNENWYQMTLNAIFIITNQFLTSKYS
jgi:hypothetical protein